MYLKNYCTDIMFLVVIVCVTYSSTTLSLIFFNICLHKIFNLYLQVLILKIIHKFKQKDDQ